MIGVLLVIGVWEYLASSGVEIEIIGCYIRLTGSSGLARRNKLTA